MNKHSDDYIPYACELMAARDEAAAKAKETPDPRHEYLATYLCNGNNYTEKVYAINLKEAECQLKQQLGLVGMFPYDLKITSVEDTNVNIA